MKKTWAIVALFSVFGTSAYAAEPLTLKDAVQQTVLGNPDVLRTWNAFQAVESERTAAEGGYLPKIDLIAGAGREYRDDPLVQKNYTRYNSSLSLTQMLFDGFATRSEVQRLDHTRMVRLYELQDASENAALEAAKAYLDVLRYRRLVSLTEDNYVRHRVLFEQIQKKVEAGVGRKVDLEQASGRLALAESNLLTDTSNLHDVSARFIRVVGSNPAKDLKEAELLKKDIPADVSSALSDAQRRNPGLRAAIENTLAANAALAGRDAAFKPRVDFRLRHDQGDTLNGYSGMHRNDVAEVVMTYNLYNGGSDKARVSQFMAQRDQAREARDKTCRDIRQTLAIAYNDVRKLNEQLAYLDQHQLAIEKARDAYIRQFDIGQRTLLDLLDTENELFQAKRAYVAAEYDLGIAYVRTHAARGNLLGVLGVSRVGQDQVQLPEDWNEGGEAPESCPAEAPQLYQANLTALDERAQREVAAKPVVKPAPAAAQPVAVAVPESAPAGNAHDAVSKSLNDWVSAWAKVDLESYLAFYAPDFVPSEGGSREAWAGRRAKVFKQARNVQLEISKVEFSSTGLETATTTFRQSYKSSGYKDVVKKTLLWKKYGDRWLIVRENAAK